MGGGPIGRGESPASRTGAPKLRTGRGACVGTGAASAGRKAEARQCWAQAEARAAGSAPERPPSWAACTDPTGAGPRLYFQRVPEGKVVKNRVHLDVRVGTGLVGEERQAVLEAEGARLEALGAARVRLLVADEENESCLVMQDVEGNEFCLD